MTDTWTDENVALLKSLWGAYRPERPSKGLFRLSAIDFDARTNPRFIDNRETAEPADA